MTDQDKPNAPISQEEIDALQAAAAEPGPSAPLTPEEIEKAMAEMAGEDVPASAGADEMEAAMMAMAGEKPAAPAPRPAPAGARAAAAGSAPATKAFSLPDLKSAAGPSADNGLNLLDDVELEVKIELGRTELFIEDVLRLGVGSVVELDKLAGDPVDIYVNERLVARGEVLVLNENFCVRVNDILSPVPELGDPE